MKNHRVINAFLILFLLPIGTVVFAQDEWPHYGGNQWNERHADLKKITRESVGTLVPRRVLQLDSPTLGLAGSPLVVDGKLYISAASGWVHAFDLRTGLKIWSNEHPGTYFTGNVADFHKSGTGAAPACCGNVSRGLAYANGTIFAGNQDATVTALDAETGKKKWEVLAVAKEDNPAGIYGYNSAPVIAGNNIVIGTTGGESATRHHLTAFDQKTGKKVWRWYSVPAPDGSDPVAPDGWWKFSDTTVYGVKLPYRDIEQEKMLKDIFPNAWKTGAGAMWTPVVYDPELNLIYISVGNPNPDADGRVRPGDNLFTNSVVAVDAKTGKTRWYFQISPHDLWDRDPASPPVVTMLEGRKVVVQAGKIGWLFVMDAATGEFIRMSKNFVPQDKNMFLAPVEEEGPPIFPASSGGNGWSPISVDRERSTAYVGAMHLPASFKLEEDISLDIGRPAHGMRLGGMWKYKNDEAAGYLSAIDLLTGDIKWQHKTGMILQGGVLSTSTGLVFQGESDGHFSAFDAETGEILWRFHAGAGVNAPPISFVLDGEEFIAVAAGGSNVWGTPLGNAVFVFGLPKRWKPAAKK